MKVIADLQIHSKYSRAVSPQMVLPQIALWAKRKGIGLMATGDWTHPMWFREIVSNLEELGNGLLKLKHAQKDDPLFLLATEVSCIYSQGGKGRRVHTLIWVPTIASAQKINKEMTKQGCNLLSDGRPIIGLTSIQVAELVLTIEPRALIIPAHAWTPWFSVYGSMSGFNSLEEAFGNYAKHIYAVETGLSSNPSMNWRIKELDRRSIVSFSDAHSGPKLGREATVFDLTELSYDQVYKAIQAPSLNHESRSMNHGKENTKNPASPASRHDTKYINHDSRILNTIEFYPEEGKYHWSGHRACKIRWSPGDTDKKGNTCPVCGKALTQGVEQRVSELAGRSDKSLELVRDGMMIRSKTFPKRPPFVMLVPLQEIISESIGSPVTSPKVQSLYGQLTDTLGDEFTVLMKSSGSEIAKIAGDRVSVGVEKVRTGDLLIDPGFDGVFGVVKLWHEGETKPLIDSSREQLTIFNH